MEGVARSIMIHLGGAGRRPRRRLMRVCESSAGVALFRVACMIFVWVRVCRFCWALGGLLGTLNTCLRCFEYFSFVYLFILPLNFDGGIN